MTKIYTPELTFNEVPLVWLLHDDHTATCTFELAGTKIIADPEKVFRSLRDTIGIYKKEDGTLVIENLSSFTHHVLLDSDSISSPRGFFPPPPQADNSGESIRLRTKPHALMLDYIIPETEAAYAMWRMTLTYEKNIIEVHNTQKKKHVCHSIKAIPTFTLEQQFAKNDDIYPDKQLLITTIRSFFDIHLSPAFTLLENHNNYLPSLIPHFQKAIVAIMCLDKLEEDYVELYNHYSPPDLERRKKLLFPSLINAKLDRLLFFIDETMLSSDFFMNKKEQVFLEQLRTQV